MSEIRADRIEAPNMSGDLVNRRIVMESLKNEYNRRFNPGVYGRLSLAQIEKAVNTAPSVEAIPVSWIEAKIELVNSLPGVSMLKMKTADWRDMVEQWKAEQRSPEVDHDAQIREFAEEMSKHGVT